MTAADPRRRLTYAEIEAEGLADWRLLLGALRARFETGSFATGLALVDRVGAAAGAADHHPDVTLTYPRVDLTLRSHDVAGVTRRDVDLARLVSAYAAEAGVRAAPQDLTALEYALDVPTTAPVREFWAVALGFEARDDGDDVTDPAGRWPTVWFQDAPGATGEVQQRFHADVWVPREIAEQRVAAAVAAGGTLVSDAEAPAFWLLADQHGNKVCICTADGR